jgi:hypothetical protein
MLRLPHLETPFDSASNPHPTLLNAAVSDLKIHARS